VPPGQILFYIFQFLVRAMAATLAGLQLLGLTGHLAPTAWLGLTAVLTLYIYLCD
jgi:hypothetical protein